MGSARQPVRQDLQDAMWDHVGVIRTEQGLNKGISAISGIRDQVSSIGVEGSNLAFNLSWHDWLNMESLLDISDAIAGASLARENSRGAHFREDHPDQGSLEASYFTIVRKGADDLEVSRQYVDFTIVKPGETILPESEPETLVAHP